MEISDPWLVGITRRGSIEFAYDHLGVGFFVFVKGLFPPSPRIIFERGPAESSGALRKGRAAQPQSSRAPSKVQWRFALWAGQVREQWRNLWWVYAAFPVEIYDAIAVRVSGAAKEGSKTAFAQQHWCAALGTRYVGLFR